MFQLLSPTGLWALAALSLPLAIHLWRPPPRMVRLGSLRFLENLPRRLRNLRWRDRWLLAVRLALLILLALLLAGPFWQRRPTHAPQRWILLDPNVAPDAGSSRHLRVLKSAGYETHALAPGFPLVSATTPRRNDPAPDLWSLLREADAELPAGSALAVFSPGRLASLRGSRPALQHTRVEWVRTPDAPPGRVEPSATPPAPAPLGVVILHDAGHADSARYISAAVHAAAQVGGRVMNVRTVVSDPSKDDPTGAAWVFWLSAQPLPSGWMERGVNVVSEAADTGDRPNFPASWIVATPDVPGASAFLDPVRLWRRAAPPLHPSGAVEWTDGFGRPLLTVAREAQGRHWLFYGRFDPAWNDLPRRGALAEWMLGLLSGQDGTPPLDPIRDRRLADPSQYRTSDAPPARVGVTLSRDGNRSIDLHGPFWTLAAVLFGLERAWSHRRRRPAVAPGPAVSVAAPSR